MRSLAGSHADSHRSELQYPLTGHFPSLAMQTLPPPLCPNKEEFGVCVGRQTFTHRKLLPVENEGEMWGFNAARAGKPGIFFPQQGHAWGGGSVRPWVLGRGKTLAVIPPLAESRLASGGSPLVSRREGKCESGDLRSQIKGDVGVILKFFYTHTQECASSSSSGIVSKSGSFVVDCTYSLTNYYYQITQILPFEPQKKQRKTKSNFSCGRQTKLERDQRALQSCSFPSPRKVSEVTVSPKLAS